MTKRALEDDLAATQKQLTSISNKTGDQIFFTMMSRILPELTINERPESGITSM